MKSFLLWLLLLPQLTFSQKTITGTLTDSTTALVPFASVQLLSPADSAIVAYAISKGDGRYSLRFATEGDSVLVKFAHLSYAPKFVWLPNRSQQFDVQLQDSEVTLQEILVKQPPPIAEEGDTLTYDVLDFQQEADRSIADVLKRMPGFEVEDNGRVLYQGEPISRYYIEGLDLLESRYGLANRNLPAGAVAKVEVLKNHQHVKLLDSLIVPNEAAVNIKLRSGVAVTGEATTGAGSTLQASPNLIYRSRITPMLFAKTEQAIATYQADNSGTDLSYQLNALTIAEVMDMRNGTAFSRDYLNLNKPVPYMLPSSRWLNHRTHLASPNYLKKLNENLQLKFNLSYYNDRRNQQAEVNTQFATPTDTIQLREVTAYQAAEQQLLLATVVENNSEKLYFKNKLELHGRWSDATSTISGTQGVEQQLENPFFKAENWLSLYVKQGKKVVNFDSWVAHQKLPNRLQVTADAPLAALRLSTDLTGALQETHLQEIFANHSAGFIIKLGKLVLNSKAGFNYIRQQLGSSLSAENTNFLAFENKAKLHDSEAFTRFTGTWYYKGFRIEPVAYVSFRSLQFNSADTFSTSRSLPLVAPQLDISRNFGSRFEARTVLERSNSFNTISSLYLQPILTSYRSLSSYQPQLRHTIRDRAKIVLKYQHILAGFFASAIANRSINYYEQLAQTSIGEQGSTVTNWLLQPNTGTSSSVSTNLSQRLHKLKITLKFNASYFTNERERLIETDLLSFSNKNISLSPGIYFATFKDFSADYSYQHNVQLLETAQGAVNEFTLQNHRLTLNATLKKRHIFNWNHYYYLNEVTTGVTSAYFADLSYRFKLNKKNELVLNWQNIFNSRNFETAAVGEFFTTSTRYILRPAQLIASFRWSF